MKNYFKKNSRKYYSLQWYFKIVERFVMGFSRVAWKKIFFEIVFHPLLNFSGFFPNPETYFHRYAFNITQCIHLGEKFEYFICRCLFILSGLTYLSVKKDYFINRFIWFFVPISVYFVWKTFKRSNRLGNLLGFK